LFRELTQKRLRRGNFIDVKDLITAIKEYLTQNNKQPKPFIWKLPHNRSSTRSVVVKEFLRHYTSNLDLKPFV